MKKILCLCMVLIISVCVFSACSEKKNSGDGIVGEWKCNTDLDKVVVKGTFVFNEDGTGTAPGADSTEITWSVYDGKIYIERKGSSPYYYDFKLKGDTLTLIKANGDEAVFTRVG